MYVLSFISFHVYLTGTIYANKHGDKAKQVPEVLHIKFRTKANVQLLSLAGLLYKIELKYYTTSNSENKNMITL